MFRIPNRIEKFEFDFSLRPTGRKHDISVGLKCTPPPPPPTYPKLRLFQVYCAVFRIHIILIWIRIRIRIRGSVSVIMDPVPDPDTDPDPM